MSALIVPIFVSLCLFGNLGNVHRLGVRGQQMAGIKRGCSVTAIILVPTFGKSLLPAFTLFELKYAPLTLPFSKSFSITLGFVWVMFCICMFLQTCFVSMHNLKKCGHSEFKCYEVKAAIVLKQNPIFPVFQTNSDSVAMVVVTLVSKCNIISHLLKCAIIIMVTLSGQWCTVACMYPLLAHHNTVEYTVSEVDASEVDRKLAIYPAH